MTRTANECLLSAAHWDRIALDDEAAAEWDREHGIDMSSPGQSPGDHRARRARACAESLRLEAATGREHCTECLGAHANSLHPHLG